MKSLIDIVHGSDGVSKANSQSFAVSTQAGIQIASNAILGRTLGDSKASKFAEGAATIITDKKFLEELEGEIGLPKTGETEDEFVARAKKAMFEMLQIKLK